MGSVIKHCVLYRRLVVAAERLFRLPGGKGLPGQTGLGAGNLPAGPFTATQMKAKTPGVMSAGGFFING
jgi:hypothetical protein